MARPANYQDELDALKGTARAASLRYQRAYARFEELVRAAAGVEATMEAWKVCEMELKNSEKTFAELLRFQGRRKAMHQETTSRSKQSAA